MHDQENLYQKDRNFHVKPVFQESLYLTGIGRGWAKYRDLSVASKSNYWQIKILCDNRGQQLFYHSITQFVFIFKSLSDSSRKRSAIFNVSPESVVFITPQQNIICADHFFQTVICKSRGGFSAIEKGVQMHRMIMWDIYGCFACHLEGDRLLLTELMRSVWENLNQSRKDRPNALRSADTPPRSIFSHTDRLSSNKMFIVWKTRKY